MTQNGSRQRTFVYDAMSRLTSETNPESGTLTYGYDAGTYKGDLTSRVAPAPNQTGSNTVTTTYAYDSLHRLTQKNYSDSTTPTAYFIYDETSNSGVTESNTKGRLTTEGSYQNSVWLAATKFSYDAMGRVILNPQETQTSWFGWQPSYSYDLAGNVTSYTNGAGVTLTQSFDVAGRVTSLTSSLVDSQHPATLFTADSSFGYYPASILRKGAFGNGLTKSNVYNNLLQPCLIDVNNNSTTLQTCNDSTPAGNVLDFWMSYNAGSNSGNVVNWNATGAQSFVRTFGYDSLNRLAQMQETTGAAEGCKPSSSSSNPYSITWGYDAWGNRTSQSPNAGTCGFSQNFNTQNQLSSPYQYDAAGNMTYDASHSYTYDAENRVVSVDGGATATYVYDAIGRRMQRTVGGSTTNYIYDMAGNVGAEFGCATCWSVGYIYLNGQVAALYANSTTYFVHADHLGSTRLLTGMNQSVVQNLDYLPFGEIPSSDSGTSTHKFTGDERDSETNLDHTWFRQYSSSLGRWMRHDPAGLAAVDPSNPQSFNRYAYVGNRPLTLVDNLGLDSFPICFETEGPYVCFWPSGGGGSGPGGGPPCTVQAVPDSDSEFVVAGYGLPEDFMEMAPPPERCGGGASNTSGSWWGTFAKSFFGNFSLKGARLPGESFAACFDRTQQALLGNEGKQALGVVSGVSLATSVLTASPTQALSYSSTTPGEVVNELGAQISGDVIETTLVPNSIATRVIATSVAQGATTRSVGVAFTKGLGVVGKATSVITAVGLGLEGGFASACR